MTTKIGDLGEQLVNQWLQSKSYRILHHKWRCRWGEIDLIAEDINNSTLVFVEVKTRNNFNWDCNGLEAISDRKQQKLSQSAALFIANNPQYIDFYMRFDVAIVKYHKVHNTKQGNIALSNSFKINKPCFMPENEKFIQAIYEQYNLEIINYLENAFELS